MKPYAPAVAESFKVLVSIGVTPTWIPTANQTPIPVKTRCVAAVASGRTGNEIANSATAIADDRCANQTATWTRIETLAEDAIGSICVAQMSSVVRAVMQTLTGKGTFHNGT
jgi:hypothetical protein